MSDREIKLILQWIGFNGVNLVDRQMFVDAINYAYKMGYTDGGQG